MMHIQFPVDGPVWTFFTGPVSRTAYPGPDGCVHEGFDGIQEQRCALRIKMGRNTIKGSQYITKYNPNQYDLLQHELLPRKIKKLPKFQCEYKFMDNKNYVFCPPNEGYQCVGGGFHNVLDKATTATQDDVWMNWPL